MGMSCDHSFDYVSSDGSCGQENMLCERPPLSGKKQGVVRALVSRINEMTPTPSREGQALQSRPATGVFHSYHLLKNVKGRHSIACRAVRVCMNNPHTWF
jgi:hypothetical protein